MQKNVLMASAFGLTCYLGYSKVSDTHSTALTHKGVSSQFTLTFSQGNAITNYIIEHSRIKDLLQAYKPSWFYFSSVVGNFSSVFIPLKEVPEHVTH